MCSMFAVWKDESKSLLPSIDLIDIGYLLYIINAIQFIATTSTDDSDSISAGDIVVFLAPEIFLGGVPNNPLPVPQGVPQPGARKSMHIIKIFIINANVMSVHKQIMPKLQLAEASNFQQPPLLAQKLLPLV